MKEIDMSKLDVAIKYIKRMSEGHNPVTNQLAEDSVLENANVVRCLFFVADVLEQVRENGGIVAKKEKKARKEKFSCDVLESFTYKEDKSIMYLVRQINEAVDTNVMKALSVGKIVKALKLEGYLMETYMEENGEKITLPTEKGKEIGIYSERKISSVGKPYYSVIYNQNAQMFLKENLEQLLMNED